MMRIFAAALAAAVIAIGTGSGALAQAGQVQPGDELPPLLMPRDFGGDFTGLIVTQPTLVMVAGDSQVCPDAVKRVQAAARSLNNMTVVIAKPSATSKTKDMTWVLVFTPGFDDRTEWARTFGMPEFNACAYGDALEAFLTQRQFRANALMAADRAVKHSDFVVATYRKYLNDLYEVPHLARSQAVRDSINWYVRQIESQLESRLEQMRLIGALLDEELADARLQPEKLSPQ